MKRLISLLFVLGALAHSATPVRAAQKTTLDVFAAASLVDAFDAIAKAFEKSNPDVKVRIQYGGTQQLAAQIEHGAGADVFASADERWMTYLVGRKLVVGDPRFFAANSLVFITPKSNPGRVGGIKDAARSGVKVIVGAESVPVGAYTRLALAKLSSDPAYGEDFGRRVLRNVVSQEESVRALVSKIALGEADAGFAYRSDVTNGTARHVSAIELPAAARIVAYYPIAAIAGRQTALANRFIEFVRSPAGQELLAREKFLPVP
jgi:molybdate transport system substrate-binding protein